MARREPASGAQGPRVARRGRTVNQARRELLARLEALAAPTGPDVTARYEAGRLALRYLESSRPTRLPGLPPVLTAAEQEKLAHVQADLIVKVIRKVLDGLDLSDENFRRGIALAQDALREGATPGWGPL